MRILKFGGTSLASPDLVRTILRLVQEAERREPVAVVVSAFGGVTNSLVEASGLAAQGEEAYETVCNQFEQRHLEAVETLADGREKGELRVRVTESVRDLRNLFRGAALVRECSPRTLDSIMSYGERLSALIVAAALRRAGSSATACDARALILTNDRFGKARVQLRETEQNIRSHFERCSGLQIVPGFVGATEAGEITTLGRGGSDYTAALLGAALDASSIEIWTDVDGVMSADPRLVPSAFPLKHLSYEELMELSHFGAKVVYPPTVHPARRQSIPLVIRNTFNVSFPGTRVVNEGSAKEVGIRGISSISHVALLRLEGDGMVGVPGIAMRLFGTLARKGINVIFISQASSEHSICFAVEPGAVGRAKAEIGEEFALERQAGLVDDLVVEEEMSVIAAVGSGMRERPGIAGKLFGVLGRRGINVRAITQGSSELNITLVTAHRDEAQALNAIHEAFFSPEEQAVRIYLAGAGRVGGAFLEQLGDRAEALAEQEHIRLKVAGIATRRAFLVDPEGIDSSSWRKRLQREGKPADLDGMIRKILSAPRVPAIFVDCSASETVPACYPALLKAGVPVVSANKRPFAGDLKTYHELEQCARRGQAVLLYETTVGAGLPVVGTLAEMVRTGDRVQRIEGMFSGTLGFVLGKMHEGVSFSAALREAQTLGYTEPDPREDLNGIDVARKLLILAREAGFELEPNEIEVSPLLPDDSWLKMSLDEFWQAAPALDGILEKRERAARESGKYLCYLARVDEKTARVGLETINGNHPCAGLSGTDNLIAFTTSRYHVTPLVIRGPGAGPEVTAAGVFSDILRAASKIR